jgi:hypothetical protein
VILLNLVCKIAFGNVEKNKKGAIMSGLLPFTKMLLADPRVKKTAVESEKSYQLAREAALEVVDGEINMEEVYKLKALATFKAATSNKVLMGMTMPKGVGPGEDVQLTAEQHEVMMATKLRAGSLQIAGEIDFTSDCIRARVVKSIEEKKAVVAKQQESLAKKAAALAAAPAILAAKEKKGKEKEAAREAKLQLKKKKDDGIAARKAIAAAKKAEKEAAVEEKKKNPVAKGGGAGPGPRGGCSSGCHDEPEEQEAKESHPGRSNRRARGGRRRGGRRGRRRGGRRRPAF